MTFCIRKCFEFKIQHLKGLFRNHLIWSPQSSSELSAFEETETPEESKLVKNLLRVIWQNWGAYSGFPKPSRIFFPSFSILLSKLYILWLLGGKMSYNLPNVFVIFPCKPIKCVHRDIEASSSPLSQMRQMSEISGTERNCGSFSWWTTDIHWMSLGRTVTSWQQPFRKYHLAAGYQTQE